MMDEQTLFKLCNSKILADLFDATEEWFRKNAPDRFKVFSEIEKGGSGKWKSKILKTEITFQKIRKISDLPFP